MTALSQEPELDIEETYAADLSPEVEWYLESRGYELPEHIQPLWRTPEPRDVEGAYFDPIRVDSTITALSALRHTQGDLAGQPLIPDVWQIAFIIAPVFGWVHVNSKGAVARIIRSAWIEVPRKNGKTTIAAAIALILAFGDGEPGAQVYAAAAAKEQAMLAYTPAKLIAESTPAFKRSGIKALGKQIVRRRDNSFMKAVAALGDLLQGTNPNGYIVDELHVHKSADVIDALESGTGARSQPLGLIITTADDGGAHTVYADRRSEIQKLCSGSVKNHTKYGVIFGARITDDPYSEDTWACANPGYPVSPTKEFMESEALAAKASPANLTRFQRLNLNVRTKQDTKFITMDSWNRNAGEVNEADLVGWTCYTGVDLGSVSDLSAACHLFPHPDGTYSAIWRFWTPEENLPALDKATNGAASRWVADGWLVTTPGNVTDYDYIEMQLVADSEKFDIRSVGYDPWSANQLVTALADTHGLRMIKVRQGFYSLSGPTKECQRLLLKGTAQTPFLRHGGNPVMRWMTDNLAVEFDPAGNVKPTKTDKGKRSRKIDGWSSLVTAMSECILDSGSEANSGDTEAELF